MGIVNIDEELHDQMRKASTVSCRSINAQRRIGSRLVCCVRCIDLEFSANHGGRNAGCGGGDAGFAGGERMSSTIIKQPDEIALMAEAGKLLAQVFTHLDQCDLIGMSTMQVNDLVDHYITHDLQARPASKGQYGYAYALNSSRNQVVCHGVPSPTEILQNGDIVNFDITLEKHGFIADSSKTYLVGDVAPAAKRLVQVTYEALWKGIKTVRPGARLGDIGFAIESHARKHAIQ